MFEVAAADAAVIHTTAAFVNQWRPMRSHHNIQILRQQARAFMQLLESVAAVRLRTLPTRSAESQRVVGVNHRDVLRSFLVDCRAASVAITSMEKKLVPEIARFFAGSAPECIRLVDAATKNLNDLRAFVAFEIDESDDEELGYEFVPPAPEGVGSTRSVALDPQIQPDCSEPIQLRFSEAAAFQVSEMRARGEADPDGIYGLFWKGIEFLLKDLCDPTQVFSAPPPGKPFEAVARSKIGKARVFFVASIQKRIVIVLMCSAWSQGGDWKAMEGLHERLASTEWDAVFEELGSLIRPTPRGRAAMVKTLRRLAESRHLSDQEARLLSRLEQSATHEPVFTEDLAETADDVLRAAEDIIDNEDADEALSEADRIPWEQVKSEFEM